MKLYAHNCHVARRRRALPVRRLWVLIAFYLLFAAVLILVSMAFGAGCATPPLSTTAQASDMSVEAPTENVYVITFSDDTVYIYYTNAPVLKLKIQDPRHPGRTVIKGVHTYGGDRLYVELAE